MTFQIKVLVVDDSPVFRIALSRLLGDHKVIDVVGAAKDGLEALEIVESKKPSIMILDLQMPNMDGLETLKELKKRGFLPQCKVIVFSSHSLDGAEMTLQALSLGAVDFISKPSHGSLSESQKTIENVLLPLIVDLATQEGGSPAAISRRKNKFPVSREKKTLIGLGISTGGPETLAGFLPLLEKVTECPVLVVQHMPPVFTRQLAERLNTKTSLNVKEAEDGEILQKSTVYIAPGAFHMTLAQKFGKRIIRLNQEPPENSARPSVDVLFRSLACGFGGQTVAVIMTGIGQDGLEGCRALKEKGAVVIAQDKASSVVYGMPRFVNEEGLADEVLPVDKIASAIGKRL